ncbi:alpha-mannosidase [Paenibacillus radicis (ex Xue et al. 2023)]|uniref:Glycosyl hydrolase-related protein n=1 Tax=Paenibacillus radicis (ex Xue et al. 2023) TaxID=2972489 RepID=A0ABT1YUL8_9BACL|nr:alpha-mannosidase [Paenibacillus radicis (ex Xue et al. 2023)]MCR8636725.1 glycosyl hydrolase-related protein [Paenibacillus radicis (ex Xue et al. 2023)]
MKIMDDQRRLLFNEGGEQPASADPLSGEDYKPVVHMIGNGHLDPVWLWQWQEGYAETKATFRSALDRMNEFPEFIFTCASAASYKWIEENDPSMFAEIKKRIAEGRWVVVGGWWVQPDCNIPSGESFARHSLYGQRYFLQRFGLTAKVGYNVDSFGHHAMLPQILKLSGMDYYVFMRPEKHEKSIPASLFWWESADGSRVMAYRIPEGYCTHQFETSEPKVHAVKKIAEEQHTDQMCFYGVGNHGGGPTIANLQEIRAVREKTGQEAIVLSSPNAYFERMEAYAPSLPVVADELQHHASGCYSTHSETKASNRKSEHRLLTAEKLSAAAHCLLDLPYDAAQFRMAWECVMFNQFHDIMGGCSIREAYTDARESYGYALHIGAVSMNAAMQKISWSIDTMRPGISSLDKNKDRTLWEQADQGIPVVVFNPLSWEVTAPVAVTQQMKGITDEAGIPVEIQLVRSSKTNGGDKYDTLFMGKIPAMGYRVYWIYRHKSFDLPIPVTTASASFTETVHTDSLRVTSSSIENDWVRLEIEPHTGYVKSLFDRRSGVEMIDGRGAVPIVIDEHDCDTWGHGKLEFRNEIGRFTDAEVKLIESGPLRATLRVTSRYGQSLLRQDYTLYKDSADVSVRVKLDWHEKHKMLKLSFPVRVDEPKATYEIPYGYLERPVNGEEEPGQQWVDLTGIVHGSCADAASSDKHTYGLSLLNNSKYSFDVKGNDLRMTIVRSAIFADHYGKRDDMCEYMDQGVQEFAYTLVPHAGSWQEAGIVRKAYELNVPLVHIVETYHKGSLPLSYCGVHLSSKQVVVTAFKRAEDGDGYILRCYETSGTETETVVDIPMQSRTWTAQFGRCEIKTFKIPDHAELPIVETNLLEL